MKTILPVGDFTWSEGRFYQKNFYSCAYEIRQFLKPMSPDEGKFYYFDASNAELFLLAHHYGDLALTEDIRSGKFWSMWVQDGFPKEDVKKDIFCMQYSASTVTFVPNTPIDFFEKFTTRYAVWWNGIKRAARLFQSCPQKLSGSYKNLTTGKLIPLPSPTSEHALFKFLNYRIQQSLSSALQIVFAEFLKWNQAHGGHNYAVNFDSCWFTNPNFSEEALKTKLDEIVGSLYVEGKIPAPFLFKWKTGKNCAEAQGWAEN